MTGKAQYRVRRAGEVAGVWREKGAVIPLTDRQARELAPPFGHVVEPVNNKEQPNGKLTRRKRADRKASD
jgi:hypothetical protein